MRSIMQVEGFRHLNRSAADRADETRRSGRSDDTRPAPIEATAGDSIDTSIASFIDSAVRDVGRQLDQRIESLRTRRDELLALADDPTAIRRAAQAFLRGGDEV